MNRILATDSYKLGHWKQYPAGTEGVYSYFESREGARWPYTVFFGLQYLLNEYLRGGPITIASIMEAEILSEVHFGSGKIFNKEGWEHIRSRHAGRLPLRIRAVPEGTVVPTGNVLMTVENTDPKCFWLTNAMESLLTHVWYPSTVATLSRTTKEMMRDALVATGGSLDSLPFMLHDFGYRGASSHESASIGGAAHLINFLGTDTLPAMDLASDYYGANLETLAFSVPATEHSIMTALGRNGECDVMDKLLAEYPSGILSVVSDSYNIYNFVEGLGSTFRKRILERDGTLVVRPDSVTQQHPYPADLVVWILRNLAKDFGSTKNSKGYTVLDPHVKVIWGDGITPYDIEKILNKVRLEGFAAENLVFGMGGGLLQKVDRDIQRFAFKSSAQKRDGAWHDVFKEPVGSNKSSKKGRLRLSLDTQGEYATEPLQEFEHDHLVERDVLETVFENGEIVKEYSFEEVRKNAAL